MLSAPATNGDVVVVQTQDDKLIGLDAASGDQRWIYESTVPVLTLRGTGAPPIAGNMALAGLASGKVVAVDVQRGLPIWEQRVAIPPGAFRNWIAWWTSTAASCCPATPSTWSATRGRAAALDVNSGRLLWQREASSYVGVAEGFRQYLRQPGQRFGEGLDSRAALLRCGTTTPWRVANCRLRRCFQQRGGRRPGRLRASAEPGGRSLYRSRAGRQRWRAGSSVGGRELDVCSG